jgi:tRNA-splicing ligase RtcB
LSADDARNKIHDIVHALFNNIPSGVGSTRKDLRLAPKELSRVLEKGARWTLENGYGSEADTDHMDAQGCIPGADPAYVSSRALERGKAQLGTLGSGNHFVEVGYVEEIFDEGAASAMGLYKDQMTVLVHTGSRGLGHQVCDDYIKVMLEVRGNTELSCLILNFVAPLWIPRKAGDISLPWPAPPISRSSIAR